MSFDECSRKAVRRSDGEGGHELAGAGASGRDGVRVLGGGRAAGQRRRASAVLRAGMAVCARTGMLVNLADTPENRAMCGCTGTAEQDGEGAAPFPQLVALTARAGRAMLSAILGSTRAGEQTLLRRLARGRSPRAAPQEPRPSHRRRGLPSPPHGVT